MDFNTTIAWWYDKYKTYNLKILELVMNLHRFFFLIFYTDFEKKEEF